jgi:hypothetical protein
MCYEHPRHVKVRSVAEAEQEGLRRLLEEAGRIGD